MDRNLSSDGLYTTHEQFLLVLDSRNATSFLNSSYNSKIRFDFEDALILPRSALNVTCSVLHFTAPNSIYNINETNNYFHIQFVLSVSPASTADISFKIPVGNYTSQTFMNKLTELMLVYGGGVSPTFGSTFSMSINSLTNQFTMTNNTYMFWLMPDNTIYNVMGFYQNQLTYSLGSTTGGITTYNIQSPFTCNFNGIQNINIHLNTFLTNNVDSFSKTKSAIIATIPVDSNQANIFYIKNNDFAVSLKEDIIDYIVVSLKDDLGNEVNLNNQHWNLTICFSIYKDIPRFQYENNFFNILRRN